MPQISEDFHPGLTHVTVPPRYREHALIRDQVFFTLPLQLLEHICKHVGKKNLDADLLDMEQTLSELCVDVASVGFWNGKQIHYLSFPTIDGRKEGVNSDFPRTARE